MKKTDRQNVHGSGPSQAGPGAGEAPSLWQVTWPLLLNLALALSLNLVDSFFLSRHSDAAAAAVGALFPLLALAMVLFSAVGQAGCSVSGQLIGAGRTEHLLPTYTVLMALMAGLGLAASLFFVTTATVVPDWLNLPAAAADDAIRYQAIVGGTQFLRALHTGYANILYSQARTGVVAGSAVLTNVLNLGLNTLFLSGAIAALPTGVEGVAWATVLSTLGGAVGVAFSVHSTLRLRFCRIPWRQATRRLRPIVAIGLPSALEPVAYQGTQILVTRIVASFGTSALAARTYTFNLYMMTTILWSIALGTSTQILIARQIGAQTFEAADRQLRSSVCWAAGGNLLIVGLMWFAHPWLVGMLTEDPRIIELTRPLFSIAFLVEAGRAFNIVAGGALRSSGDARFASLAGVGLMCSVGVPVVYLLGVHAGLGLTGIWLGLAIDECVRGYVNWRRWLSGRWQRYGVLRSEAPEVRTAPVG